MAQDIMKPVTRETSFKEEIHPSLSFTKDIAVKCNKCKDIIYRRDWERNLKVCPSCNYHFKLTAYERLEFLVDSGSFIELDKDLISYDPLHFGGPSQTYAEKLENEREKVGLNEAVVIGHATIETMPLALAVMDFRFIGGSMGAVVGEKITRAIEIGIEQHIPVFIASASGGARMQEGIYSLMQMAKTVTALAKLAEAKLPYFSLLTDPTSGGVTASFAMLGDVILAEPGGLVCFAGPRVIEQFMHKKLPKDAVTAEFVFQHGFLDAVVHRCELRRVLARLLRLYAVSHISKKHSYLKDYQALSLAKGKRSATHFDLEFEKPLVELAKKITDVQLREDQVQHNEQVQKSMRELEQLTDEIYSQLTTWQTVQVARHKDRPHAIDYIRLMCDDFFELHGDRSFGDDPSILAGPASLDGRTAMFICQQKGRDMKEKQFHNYGMPHPEGYRKAYRLMQQAEKLGLPLICLIDTPGAFPGLQDEERGQSEAIAANLYLMSRLRIPIIAVVIGEGGSGGALAIGLADRLLMLEYSIYTVAAPEAAASILWRDTSFAPHAAEAMRIRARELVETQIVDEIVPEPLGGAHRDYCLAADNLKAALLKHLVDLRQFSLEELLERRRQKFRAIGKNEEHRG